MNYDQWSELWFVVEEGVGNRGVDLEYSEKGRK